MSKISTKLVTKLTAGAGTVMLCASALMSNPAVMHADETPASQSSKTTVTVDTKAKDKYTAVDQAKTITRTIHYVDTDGKKVAPDVTETHTAQVFATDPADKTTYKAFEVVNGVAENTVPKFNQVTSPAVRGYKLQDQTFATVPEQAWSLDGTQNKNEKTGFYDALAKNEVINVVYTKDPNAQTDVSGSVPVKGYTVLSVHQLTRTVNFVDEDGKALADKNIQTVMYETVAPDTLTAKEQEDTANQKIAVINTKTDSNGKVTNDGTSVILDTPSYLLATVKAPDIAGYHLVNDKLSEIKGQYAWLSTSPHVFAELPSGLQQFITQNEIVDVVYAKGEKKADDTGNTSNGAAASNDAGKDTKTDDTKNADDKNGKDSKDAEDSKDTDSKDSDSKDSKDSKDGKDAEDKDEDKNDTAAAGAAAGKNGGGSDGTGTSGSTGSGSGVSDSDSALPQTGNTKSSSALLGGGLALILSSIATGFVSLKRRFF